MRIPARERDMLLTAGLPAGPLAEPLPYWRRGKGKLHVDRRCPGLQRRLPVTEFRAAADAAKDLLCTRCTDVLPEDAENHLQVALAILRVREHLSPACAPGGTWETVTELHLAAAVLERTLLTAGMCDAELGAVAGEALADAAAVHAEAVATLPAPAQLDGPKPVILLLHHYSPSNSSYASGEYIMAAAATILVRDLTRKFAFALLPGIAARSGCRNVVDAEPGDTAEVLATALSLADVAVPGAYALYYQREAAMTSALAFARLIHAPAAVPA